MADSAKALASLRQSYREAEALVKRQIDRASQGLPAEDIDEPLTSAVQDSVEKVFLTFYSWPGLDGKRFGSDSFLGRTYREFHSF